MKAQLKDKSGLSEFRNLTTGFFEMVRDRNELFTVRNRSVFARLNLKPA